MLCKFYGYPKKEVAKIVMPIGIFQDVVQQVTEMGFSRIGLTPLTGEVFVDKGIIEKMLYLDAHPKIESYHFFSNFVIPSEQKIKKLCNLHKLKFLHISLYGHDEESFCHITQRPKQQYYRLVNNLNSLYQVYLEHKPLFKVKMNWRTTPEFSEDNPPTSEIQDIVWQFKNTLHLNVGNIRLYNNWGGVVTNEDVQDIGLKVRDSSYVYKKGLCTLVTSRMIILANGRVNACACRDVNGSLIIGDLKNDSLSYILSMENPPYKELIQEQMQNIFRPVCKSCDFYQSLYKARKSKVPYYHFEQVKDLLGNRSKQEQKLNGMEE